MAMASQAFAGYNPAAVGSTGSVSDLSEAGYRAVLACRSSEEMKAFIRRLVQSHGGRVLNEGGLSGFAPYYSGEKGAQSFQRLVEELGQKSNERNPFVQFDPRRMPAYAQAATQAGFAQQGFAQPVYAQPCMPAAAMAVPVAQAVPLAQPGFAQAGYGWPGIPAAATAVPVAQAVPVATPGNHAFAGCPMPAQGMPVAQSVPCGYAGQSAQAGQPQKQGWSVGALAGASALAAVGGALLGAALGGAFNHDKNRWDPNVDCDGIRAEERAEYLERERGMSQHDARQQVMNEFSGHFDGHWARHVDVGWNPNTDCEGVRAEERAEWLERERGLTQHQARQQVMMEFPHNFNR